VYLNERLNHIEISGGSTQHRQVAFRARVMRCLINAAILSLAFWLALGWLMFLFV
jgi:hypothetical protein